MPLKRKKWREEEERALIDKYEEMQSDGSLGRMRTREKKFRPIAEHVNAAYHAADPFTYPFLWSWKDVSTKVQNMRHQYVLVKQKLISAAQPQSDGQDPSALDWADGLSLWSNFLRYKYVFGDPPLPAKTPDPAASAAAFPVAIGADDDGDLGLGLGFDCCGGEEVDEEGFDYEEVGPPPQPPPPPPLPPPQPAASARKKKPDKRAWAFLTAQLARLKEREARMEEREAKREQQRQRAAREVEEECERSREMASRELEEGERRRREEEREWEERMERRRVEWRKRMEGILSQHRVHMEQIQARVLNDQQAIINQLLGIVSHWASGTGGSLSDGGGLGGHHHPYLSQMNGIVQGENRVADGPDDQFIVDG